MSDEQETQRALRRRSWRTAMICFAICALFFAGGGSVIVGRSMRGAFVPWEKVDPPAGRPLELWLGEKGQVLLKTADGQLYEWARYGDPPWEAVDEPSGDTPYWGTCQSGVNSHFAVPSPPGKVRQRAEATCPGLEMATHYEVVLLENDDLWSWSCTSMGTVVAIYQGIVAVGGIGLSVFMGGLAYILGSISWKRGA